MSHSNEIDRQASLPDCPECGHNAFVVAARLDGYRCESCRTTWNESDATPSEPPAEMVKVCRRSSAGDRTVYHTTDCRYVRDSTMNDWRREIAEAWDYSECGICQRRRQDDD